MKIRQTKSCGRQAFTLIELLVVIAIIAVLMGMISSAVFKVLAKGPDIQTANEISQLQTGLESFKLKHGMYPPSQMVLHQKLSQYGTSQLETDSKAVLMQMWPTIASTTTLNWNASGSSSVTLTGDQCLVFFLGGVTSSSGPIGFSNNPANPTQTAGTRISYYEFKPNNLKSNANGFWSYQDFYGTSMAFAYFSSGKQPNNYNRYPTSDCASLGVHPYAQSWNNPVTLYLNPSTFQIISAGKDGKFGAGTTSAQTTWTPATAANIDKNGVDDLSNFSSRPLGMSGS